jgi:hypothetical protein
MDANAHAHVGHEHHELPTSGTRADRRRGAPDAALPDRLRARRNRPHGHRHRARPLQLGHGRGSPSRVGVEFGGGDDGDVIAAATPAAQALAVAAWPRTRHARSETEVAAPRAPDRGVERLARGAGARAGELEVERDGVRRKVTSKAARGLPLDGVTVASAAATGATRTAAASRGVGARLVGEFAGEDVAGVGREVADERLAWVAVRAVGDLRGEVEALAFTPPSIPAASSTPSPSTPAGLMAPAAPQLPPEDARPARAEPAVYARQGRHSLCTV